MAASSVLSDPPQLDATRGRRGNRRREPANETAAQHLVTQVLRGGAEERVAAFLERVRGGAYAVTDAVHIVDAAGRLEGIARLVRVLTAGPEARLGDLMEPMPAAIHPELDQEHVASFAAHHGLAAVPVTDEGGRLLGVVPAGALLEILRREHIEDIHRLAGIRREDARARRALEAPPTRRVRDRLPWLLLGLAGSIAAAFIASAFEGLMTRRVAIAFFVPGIVYLADAIGTQTEAIVVRGLSLSRATLGQMLLGELRTGALLGFVLGALAFPAAAYIARDIWLAIAVAVSILGAGAMATTIGLALPWAFSRAGKDPAFGSGPVATVIQDLLSLAIYLAIAWALCG